LAAAVAVAVTGFFATADPAAREVAGVFLTAEAAAAFLARALFTVGVVVDPPAQAYAVMAKPAAKVRIFRMISALVYQYAETKYTVNKS
jgi:hypothetical protein